MLRIVALKRILVSGSARWPYVALSILALLLAARFQSPYQSILVAQEPGADIDVVRVSTDLLVFPIRVVDRNRQVVLNLSEQDFAFEDKDRITSAPYFSAGTGRVAIVFALDESGSLRDIIADQREAALALFGRFKEGSRIATLRFAAKPKLIVPFGKDPSETLRAFDFSAGHNQRTAIFNGALAAIETFTGLPSDPAERRIVVLISDGLDNSSSIKPAEVIETALSRNISFYIIHLPLFEPSDGRLVVRRPAKGFRELAEKTGGQYFLVGATRSPFARPEHEDLSPVFRAIEDDLKSQYLLGFYLGSQARDGRRHRVSINIIKPGLVYSVANRSFARKHHFGVNLQPQPNGTTHQ